MECFESAVPAIFLSYAPTFFHLFYPLAFTYSACLNAPFLLPYIFPPAVYLYNKCNL